MAQTDRAHRYRGSCHCGALEMIFETDRPAEDAPLRACACSFCRRHGMRATSDPEGRVQIRVHDPGALRRYRFGLRTADFLLCGICGCYMAAFMEDEAGDRSVINVNCLDERDSFAVEAPPVSYDHEDEAGRRARRRAAWTPTELIEEPEAAS